VSRRGLFAGDCLRGLPRASIVDGRRAHARCVRHHHRVTIAQPSRIIPRSNRISSGPPTGTRLGKTIHHLLAVSAGASRETVEAPVKIIDLFSILPAVTNGWMFAAFIVAVFVWWIAPTSRR
jgi:hypothetical protein